LLVDQETPIVVGPEQFTVFGTVNESMFTPLELFDWVTSRMISTTMITTATTPAAMSQFRRRRRCWSS